MKSAFLNVAGTPLIEVRLSPDAPRVWCKLEYLNPSGSTKDRIASHILQSAQRTGLVVPGQIVIEASSGSTSIAFALACAQLGLRFIAVMPEGVSNERVLMIRAFGAEVRFTPNAAGVAGSIAEAERLGAELGAFLPGQFANPDNTAAHQIHTAGEIEQAQPDVRFDAVVSGVGTGGTLAGLYAGLRKRSPGLRPVLARPVAISEELDAECCSFSSQIPGVIDGLSKLFKPADYPGLLTIEVPQEKAIETTRLLINRGFPVGPSSGLNYAAAVMAAEHLGGEPDIVTVFPDRMERYFSTMLFAPWR
ncbi:MAG: cysteine synthase family protein [Bryobacterales bacterium]|nr:cysteine synthase family protein [Bryobacterales bacterium]